MKETTVAVFFLCVFLSTLNRLHSDEIRKSYFFDRIQESFLDIIPLAELHSVDSLTCIFECGQHDGCKAVNYNNNENYSGLHTCHLLANEHHDHPEKLTRKVGWDFYKDRSFCKGQTDHSCNQEYIHGRDCSDICQKGAHPSGIYEINPDGKQKFKVYCDMNTDHGGWTVFQKRVDNSTSFYNTWIVYKDGFGMLKKSFWLGNDKLHLLTHIPGRFQELRVDMQDNDGSKRYALYDKFLIATEEKKYKISLGNYSGNAGDSMTYHNGCNFSTKDKDNDSWNANCAVTYKGAWWYGSCHYSNLNAIYYNGSHSSYADGVSWYAWKGHSYSLPHVEMKMRPKNFLGCRKSLL